MPYECGIPHIVMETVVFILAEQDVVARDIVVLNVFQYFLLGFQKDVLASGVPAVELLEEQERSPYLWVAAVGDGGSDVTADVPRGWFSRPLPASLVITIVALVFGHLCCCFWRLLW